MKRRDMKINLEFSGGFSYRNPHARPFGIRIRRTSKNQSPPCRLAHIVRQTNRYGLAASREFASGLLGFSLKIEPEVFSELIHDLRISHGAFRVWHLLHNKTGNNRNCYPSVRTIAKLLGSDKNSIMAWLLELESALYLRIERGNKHRSNQYYVKRSVSYSPTHRVGTVHTPGVGQIPTQLSPLLNSNNSGQGGTKLDAPLALPEVKAKRVRTPDAILKALAASMRVAASEESV